VVFGLRYKAAAEFGAVDISVATVGGNPPPPADAPPADLHGDRKAAAATVAGMSYEDYLKTTTTTQFSCWHTCQVTRQPLRSRLLSHGHALLCC
jgi:hypothetical protein